MKKIAVFASGNGSNFQVIAEEFPVEFVFSDHRDAYVLERAKQLGVLSYAFELKEFESKTDYEAALVELLEEHQIDLVCLAGYMKIVGPTLLSAYEVGLSTFIQPICQNFQELMGLRMLGMLAWVSLV
ncbi:phosphoribosylglycinamide formyltransferase [Streptococcus pneumoniae 3051]|nr:phosphoribosylglycinamide formyltransferase [Streptococcus pneumoniae 3051]